MSRARTPHLSALGVELLEGLYAHRLLTTRQARELYAPDRSTRWTLAVCTDLESAGLVARVGVEHTRRETACHSRRETAWYLTPAGDTVAGHGGERRPYKMTPDAARGPLQAHTLATNEVGLAFVRAACDYGDECGPASWRNETAHRLGGGRGEAVISDALLEYVVCDGDDTIHLARLVEIDRATKPVLTVARQLEAYDRLARSPHPYPTFPEILVVMAGRDPAALGRRITTLVGLIAGSKVLTRSEVVISITTLADLVAYGPHEPIWHSPGWADGLVDLRGRSLVG